MSLKPDNWIKDMVERYQMIDNFEPQQIKKDGVGLSYGLSSYGYDVRCTDEFHLYSIKDIQDQDGVMDPKNMQRSQQFCEIFKSDHFILPPNHFVLACTYEYFRMPKNVTGLCFGKSTYARIGVGVDITPIEAGWEGQITIEIFNKGPIAAKIYAYEGIAQLLFFESDPCDVSYADRKGKYQGQKGVTHSR